MKKIEKLEEKTRTWIETKSLKPSNITNLLGALNQFLETVETKDATSGTMSQLSGNHEAPRASSSFPAGA